MVCRTRRDDAQMVRAGRTADQRWYVGRGTGRGIWCCKDSVCARGLRAGHVARALRTAVSESDVRVLLETLSRQEQF